MAGWLKALTVMASVVVLAGCAANAATKTRELVSIQTQADQAYAKQDCTTAAPLYRELADTLSDNSVVLLRLGNCLSRLNRPEDAMAAYREAVENDPQFVKAWYNLSYVQAQELARTVTQMTANVDPTDPAAERARVLANGILKAFKTAQKIGVTNEPKPVVEKPTKSVTAEEISPNYAP